MKRAFTLIELLVVVSIIAVLAAMLLPALGLVRTQARGSVCASNLRQMGMGMMQYATDAEGQLPTVCNWGGGYPWDGNEDFRDKLELSGSGWWPSVRWPTSRLCPASLGALEKIGQMARSYGMNNESLHADHVAATAPCTYVLSKVRRTTEKILLIDGLDWWLTGWGARHYVGEVYIAANSMLSAYRHTGGANVLFFDGHVERKARPVLDTLMDATAYDRHWRAYAP